MNNYRKIISKIITEANSFWADSGTVDASYAPLYNFTNGQPVTVEAYHMTPYKFTRFKIGQVNAWGQGVYLTNKPEDCSFNPETTKDWNKMRLWATFFKPFVYEDVIGDEFRNWLWSEIQNVVNEATIRDSEISKHKLSFESSYMDVYYRLLFKQGFGESFKKQSSLNVMNTIKHYDKMFGLDVYDKLSLDGMILPFGKTGMADEQNKDTVWYVCYKPNQIKSYDGNNGDYNLDSDDINESSFHDEFIEEVEDYDYLGYHGSDVIINKFTEPKSRMNTWGIGIYFTNQYEEAKKHGEHVAKCMLKIKNPLILKDSWFGNDDLLHSIGIQKLYHLGSEDSQEKIVKAGYDGIIVNNVDGNRNLKYYVVFSPEQIHILSSDFHDSMTE